MSQLDEGSDIQQVLQAKGFNTDYNARYKLKRQFNEYPAGTVFFIDDYEYDDEVERITMWVEGGDSSYGFTAAGFEKYFIPA